MPTHSKVHVEVQSIRCFFYLNIAKILSKGACLCVEMMQTH